MRNDIRRVAIIGTNGLPPRYGGFEQLAEQLVEYLAKEFELYVYASFPNKFFKYKAYKGAKLVYIGLKANGIQSILYDMVSILHAALFCDVLLLCGTSGCIVLPLVKIIFKKRTILNPDGFEFRRLKWNIFGRLFLRFSEKIGITFSDIIIADNRAIKQYIRKKYNRNPYLIEYGGDNAYYVPFIPEKIKIADLCPDDYAFTVCRIEPENNIHLILEAFRIKDDMKLVIVGNWEYSKYGKKLRNDYKKYKNLYLMDPIWDQDKLNSLRSNCSIYIHGHAVGGTNPSLVEAMWLGLFIIAYKSVFNIETTEGKAVYFKNVDELIDILHDVKENRIDKEGEKEQMKIIAQRRYRWKRIADRYWMVFNK